MYRLFLLQRLDRTGPSGADARDCLVRGVALGDEVGCQQRAAPPQAGAAVYCHPRPACQRIRDRGHAALQLVLRRWIGVGYRQMQRLGSELAQQFDRIRSLVQIDQQTNSSASQRRRRMFPDRRVHTRPKLLRNQPVERMRLHDLQDYRVVSNR